MTKADCGWAKGPCGHYIYACEMDKEGNTKRVKRPELLCRYCHPHAEGSGGFETARIVVGALPCDGWVKEVTDDMERTPE